MKLKLKAGSSWTAALANWAGELRRIDFLTRKDFSLSEQWQPTFTADVGTFTPQNTVTKFWRRDGLVHIIFYVSGTTTGNAVEIYFTLPVPPSDLMIDTCALACSVADTGLSQVAGSAIVTSKNRVKCIKYEGAIFGIGATVKLFVSGFYLPG